MSNEKFSQFTAQTSIIAGDQVVGLRSGVNTIFTANSFDYVYVTNLDAVGSQINLLTTLDGGTTQDIKNINIFQGYSAILGDPTNATQTLMTFNTNADGGHNQYELFYNSVDEGLYTQELNGATFARFGIVSPGTPILESVGFGGTAGGGLLELGWSPNLASIRSSTASFIIQEYYYNSTPQYYQMFYQNGDSSGNYNILKSTLNSSGQTGNMQLGGTSIAGTLTYNAKIVSSSSFADTFQGLISADASGNFVKTDVGTNGYYVVVNTSNAGGIGFVAGGGGFLPSLTQGQSVMGVGTTPTAVTAFTDTTNHASIDWQNRLLKNGLAATVLNWETQVLIDYSGFSSVDWSSRWVYDSTGTQISLNWGARTLDDTTSATSLNWANRILIANDGTTTNLSWAMPNLITSTAAITTTGLLTLGTPSNGSQNLILFNTNADSSHNEYKLVYNSVDQGLYIQEINGATFPRFGIASTGTPLLESIGLGGTAGGGFLSLGWSPNLASVNTSSASYINHEYSYSSSPQTYSIFYQNGDGSGNYNVFNSNLNSSGQTGSVQIGGTAITGTLTYNSKIVSSSTFADTFKGVISADASGNFVKTDVGADGYYVVVDTTQPGGINFVSPYAGTTWINVTAPTYQLVNNNSYFAQTSYTAFTLPLTASVGATIQVASPYPGGPSSVPFTIVGNAGQQIIVGASATGSARTLTANGAGSAITLVCSTPNTIWIAVYSIGNYGLT